MNAVVISGLLYNISDNIIPFIKGNDLYVHTWNTEENKRFIGKLRRYQKYCNNFKLAIQEPKFDFKLFSYFYSTYKAISLVEDIDQYNRIIKFKPNLDTLSIQYRGRLGEYFYKASMATRPMLSKVTKEECIYGSIYYRNLDERLFSGYPLAFKKLFRILKEEEFITEMKSLHKELLDRYESDYEGSIFWTNWIENKNIKIIQDTDLKLPNNLVYYENNEVKEGRDRRAIEN